MAKIGLSKGSGKWSKVREKSVKSQGILKTILSGNPVKGQRLYCLTCVVIRLLDKDCVPNINFLISQPKHVVGTQITVSMRCSWYSK